MKFIHNILLSIAMVLIVLIVAATLSAFSNWIYAPEAIQPLPPVEVKEVQKPAPKKVTKKISAKEKKARFYALVTPHIQKVHNELMQRYLKIQKDLNSGTNAKEIAELKKRYKAQSNEELLFALKPHPQSIVLAQAVLESSWGTSRLFVEANNIFGMKSHRPNEARISSGKKTVWFKKFETLEESVREYYKIIAKRKEYREFRKARYLLDDPLKMIEKLNNYAEIGDKYPQELAKLMRHNRLQEYDE
jgi:Bax protein